MAEPIVDMRNIEKHFGNVIALAGVSCENRTSDQRAFYALVERVRRDQAVAVIVPHLNQIPALAGADRRGASRYLHAALLTVVTDPPAGP